MTKQCKPIIFDGESVRAIMAGHKTQTRRVVMHPTINFVKRVHSYKGNTEFDLIMGDESGTVITCPYGRPGDLLWVREAWGASHTQYLPGLHCWHYADGEPPFETGPAWRRRSPIHMPKWASRITLQVMDVRVERLQQISNVDIEAEMAWAALDDTAPANFADRWNGINEKRGWPWALNPWVWAITFKIERMTP